MPASTNEAAQRAFPLELLRAINGKGKPRPQEPFSALRRRAARSRRRSCLPRAPSKRLGRSYEDSFL